MSNVLSDLSNALAAAAEQAGKSTVLVNARRRLPASGIAFTSDLVMTADHVVQRDEDITVTLADGSAVSAHVAGRDPGSDLAVLRLEKGKFGFTDMVNTRLDGNQKLVDEMTIKDGKIVYDLNGMEALPWTAPEGDISNDRRWTSWPRPKPRPDDGVKLH